MIIGITGSSGAGKSIISEILEMEYQAKIINADEIARRLSYENDDYLTEIVASFGTEILLDTGELDRRKLADIIYKSEEKRKDLNAITFKYIIAEIKRAIRETQEKLIIIDAPLLFEANLQSLCDVTIAVITRNLEIQITRIMERDAITKEQAMNRLKAQHSNEFYISKCSYSIVNEGNIQEVEKQIETIFRKLERENER